jgi:hypothetical protein
MNKTILLESRHFFPMPLVQDSSCIVACFSTFFALYFDPKPPDQKEIDILAICSSDKILARLILYKFALHLLGCKKKKFVKN